MPDLKTTMKTFLSIALLLLAAANSYVSAFQFVPNAAITSASMRSCSTALHMAQEDDLIRASKSKRYADVDDNVVELKRPLGIVLDQDENGNVYVETVAPRGNAARTGAVKEGDYVVMCSATFGDQMWSTRGVGLARVLNAIKVRAGPTVKLVFESPADSKRKASTSAKAARAAEEARQRAQEKREALLEELDKDEKRLKKGKFLGLF